MPATSASAATVTRGWRCGWPTPTARPSTGPTPRPPTPRSCRCWRPRAAYGERHAEYATVLQLRASFAGDLGDWAAARDDYRRAVEVRTAAQGADHPDTVYALRLLAGALYRLGDWSAAEQAERDIL